MKISDICILIDLSTKIYFIILKIIFEKKNILFYKSEKNDVFSTSLK